MTEYHFAGAGKPIHSHFADHFAGTGNMIGGASCDHFAGAGKMVIGYETFPPLHGGGGARRAEGVFLSAVAMLKENTPSVAFRDSSPARRGSTMARGKTL